MAFKFVLLLALAVAVTIDAETTPVPILKQINRVNDDGSYTYGFESADGSFKIETRDVDGNVKGKYGYLDETGVLKTVEYAAGKPGFEAKGDHLPEQPTAALPVPPVDDDDVPVRPVPARLPVRAQPAAQQQPASTGTLATPSVSLPSFNDAQFAPQPHQLNQLPFAPMPTFNQQPAMSGQFNNGPSRGFSLVLMRLSSLLSSSSSSRSLSISTNSRSSSSSRSTTAFALSKSKKRSKVAQSRNHIVL